MKFRNYIFICNERTLFKDNEESVKAFLYSALGVCPPIFTILLFVLSCLSIQLHFIGNFTIVYLVFFLLSMFFLGVYFLFKGFIKRHPLPFAYLFFVMLALMAFYTNFAQETPTPYVSVICFLFVTPTILLDRTWRVTLYCTLMLIASIIFSYIFKSRAFLQADLTNLLTFYFAGSILGVNIRRIRLKEFDATRILALERNTDPLTNLANRRKLFEYLHRGIKDSLMRPTGMFMIDIDKFKLFNDTYGHRSGDMCLRAIGQCFEVFGRKNNIKFFRYGGEEFCALCWTKSYSELSSAGSELVRAVSDLAIPFMADGAVADMVTISLGFSKFVKEDPYNFEDMIKITDSALYKAKNGGRNRVVGAEDSMLNFVDHL